jgi:serine protease
MAAPVVAGGAALMLERAQTLGIKLSAYQIKKILANTGDPMKDPRTQGFNRLNLEKALSFTAQTVPQDAGNVLVQVTDLVEGARIPSTDVILTPLEKQNKNLDYLGKTANGAFDAAGAPEERRVRGVASFYGVEPGWYEVKVAGSSWLTTAGTRTTLLGKVRVESGKTTRLQYQHQYDFYEFTATGVRNGSPSSAFDLTKIPDTVLAEPLLLGGTFDNNYTNLAFPGAEPGTKDTDVFAVTIAAGKTLTASVYSSKLGAAGAGVVSIVAADEAVLKAGENAPATSPADQIASLTNETTEPIVVYVRYAEKSGAGGLDYWYAHTIQVK